MVKDVPVVEDSQWGIALLVPVSIHSHVLIDSQPLPRLQALRIKTHYNLAVSNQSSMNSVRCKVLGFLMLRTPFSNGSPDRTHQVRLTQL